MRLLSAPHPEAGPAEGDRHVRQRATVVGAPREPVEVLRLEVTGAENGELRTQIEGIIGGCGGAIVELVLEPSPPGTRRYAVGFRPQSFVSAGESVLALSDIAEVAFRPA